MEQISNMTQIELKEYIRGSLQVAKDCKVACLEPKMYETAAFWSGHVIAYENLLLMLESN